MLLKELKKPVLPPAETAPLECAVPHVALHTTAVPLACSPCVQTTESTTSGGAAQRGSLSGRESIMTPSSTRRLRRSAVAAPISDDVNSWSQVRETIDTQARRLAGKAQTRAANVSREGVATPPILNTMSKLATLLATADAVELRSTP